MSPSDSNKNAAWAQLFLTAIRQGGEKKTHFITWQDKKKILTINKIPRKNIFDQQLCFIKTQSSFSLPFYDILTLHKHFKAKQLWIILSKCFYGGTLRLICFRFWQAQCSFSVSFLLKHLSLILLFFGNISINILIEFILPDIPVYFTFVHQRARSVKKRIRIWIKQLQVRCHPDWLPDIKQMWIVPW